MKRSQTSILEEQIRELERKVSVFTIDKAEPILKILNDFRSKIPELTKLNHREPVFMEWHAKLRAFLENYCSLFVTTRRLHSLDFHQMRIRMEGQPLVDYHDLDSYKRDMVTADTLIGVLIDEIQTSRELQKGRGATDSEGDVPVDLSNKIFIVHGRDNTAKYWLSSLLFKIGLEPIILHEMPDSGNYVLSKIEQNSDVGFAFVILSPDDVGGLKGGPIEKQQIRARQNVLFEWGYFIKKLGRNRVCAVHHISVEMPSDMQGILVKEYDDDHAVLDKEIIKELRAAGYTLKTE